VKNKAFHLPLYIGGFMGPFGASIILPMFPELRESFNASSQAIGWGFTAYLLPFALLLLISGTLGERWGRKRTVRGTYLLYTAASIICALAPNLTVFLIARSFQGAANAFITPLLLAGLAEIVPPEKFGRKVGIYSSFQALGLVMAPIVGGIAADTTWRAAFWGTVAVSFTLSLFPPNGEPRKSADMPQIKALLQGRILRIGFATLAAALGPMGISVLVAVAARDNFGVSGSKAGVILLAGAVSSFILGPTWGKTLDKLGYRRSSIIAATSLTVFSALLFAASSPLTLGILWFFAGGTVGYMSVVLQALGATEIPDNRGGTLSFILSFRFLGVGLGPILWIPVIEQSYKGAMLGASAFGIISIYLLFTN
jgi:MFS family permease